MRQGSRCVSRGNALGMRRGFGPMGTMGNAQCVCQGVGLPAWRAHSCWKQRGVLQGAAVWLGLGPGPSLVMVMVRASRSSSGERLACLSFPRTHPQAKTLALWPERGGGNGSV